MRVFCYNFATKDDFYPGDCKNCPLYTKDHEHNLCMLDYRPISCPLKEQVYGNVEEDYITD